MITVVGKTRAHSSLRNSTSILAITAPSMKQDGRIASAVGKSHLPFCVGRCA
nr:MAG TPA: hypothetical protein [Caudoviricetes sp.]